MLTYIIGTVISIIISLIIKKTYGFEKKKALKMFISILPLTIISAYRYDVGWDYLDIYTRGFYYVGKYKMDWFTEPLFRYIIKILYTLFEDPLSLFIFMSTLISIFFSLCYKEYGSSKKVWIYILLFLLTRYYFCSLNIIRQALAMLIILYATKYIKERNFLKYSFFIILASQFHLLSIIYIPLYFVLLKDISKSSNLIMLIMEVPLALALFKYLVDTTKYSIYFETMFGNDGSLYYSEVLIAIVIIVSSIPIYKNIRNNDYTKIFFNMELIAFILSMLSFMLPTADRIIWYFSINNIFLIPNLIDLYTKPINKIIIAILLFSTITIVFVNQTILSDSYSVVPYQSIIYYRNNT